MSELWNNIADIFFPTDFRCVICGREIAQGTPYAMCHECKVEWNSDRICVRCGKTIHNEADYCERCMNNERAFDAARSAVRYKGTSVALVRGLKFGRKKYLADIMQQIMLETAREQEWKIDVVVPVPLSKKRLKLRGFNQAELLATAVAQEYGAALCNDVLYKVKDIAYQARLSARERVKNIDGCFAVVDDGRLSGKNVLLVDDVMTTGATAEECCKMLRTLRPNKVYVLTFASTEQNAMRSPQSKRRRKR